MVQTSDLDKVQLRTVKATMHTVEDTVGNALVSMKFVLQKQLRDEKSARDTQSLLLEMIDETMGQLRAISNLNTVNVKPFSGDTYYLDVN